MRAASNRQIDPDYRHHPKQVIPRENLALGQARLKWYDIAAPDRTVPQSIADMAISYLQAEHRSGRLGLEDELGFVLLHRCGEEFYFLIVCTWRGSNELWESVYYKKDNATPGFSLFPREQRHKGTYCVWEMGAVWHETKAWREYLYSPRDQGGGGALSWGCVCGRGLKGVSPADRQA